MARSDDNGSYEWEDEAMDTSASPIPGVDWQTFRSFLARVLHGDDTVPSVMLQRVQAALQGGETDLESKTRRWWQNFLLQQMIADHLRRIDELIDQYNTMADWHREQAELARAQMVEVAEKLTEIGNFIDGVNDVLREKDKTGRFDSQQAARLLRMRGIEIGPNEDERTLMLKLIQTKRMALEERAEWSQYHDTAEAEAKRHDELESENRRQAQELVDRRDTIRNADLDAQEEERRLREIADEYEADVLRKAADIEMQRQGADSPSANLRETSLETAKISQASQTANDVLADFESLASGVLAQEFALAANPIESAPSPDRPQPTSPAFSV